MIQGLESIQSVKQPQTLQEGWVEFVSRFEPFELYCTLTFIEDTHPEQAERRFKRFIRKINESLYGRRYREKRKSIYYVRAIELQRRGVIHFHALLGGGVYKLHRLRTMKLWESEKGNGMARIEKYNPTLGARTYLSKYVSKGKGGELDIFIPNELRRHLGIEEDFNSSFDFQVSNKAIPVITRNSM